MDSFRTIKHPVSTEKTMRLMEADNKLVFVVDRKATKPDIKAAIKEIFNAEVKKVNTFITSEGVKKAYVTFSMETPAIDIATQLGLM